MIEAATALRKGPDLYKTHTGQEREASGVEVAELSERFSKNSSWEEKVLVRFAVWALVDGLQVVAELLLNR